GYMGELTPSQKKSLRTIISGTNRMNELIGTLLNITRFESGTIAVRYRVAQIDKLAEEIVGDLELMAGNKDINLKLEYKSKSGLRLKTDSVILKEILTNLLSNAIKYTPNGGTVTLSLAARPSNILFKVTDTGWGIPKSAQDQIFSKFFR